MLRAATYARYSTERQHDRSIEDQTRNCRDRAAREGWTVVAEYADRGISGATSNRPDYQRMLAAIKRVTASGLSGEEAVMTAFEENAKDVARVGGG